MAARHGGVLVLGGSGFLGAWVLRALRRDGRAARVVSASRAPERGPAPGADVALRTVDLAADGDLAALVAAERPDRVVATAALARAADCERDPARARRLNAEAPEHLARACRDAGARLVLVSTDLVFGAHPPPPGGFREGDPPAPVGVYGRTKAEGEERVLAVGGDALVARLPLLYGPSFGRGLGASDALLAAVAAGRRPPLFVDEWRTPLEVGNAAEALVELAFRAETGRLHVAGPDRASRWELGRAVLEAAGRGAEAERLVERAAQADVDAGAPRAADTCLDASRARALLATPLLGIAAGLERARDARPSP